MKYLLIFITLIIMPIYNALFLQLIWGLTVAEAFDISGLTMFQAYSMYVVFSFMRARYNGKSEVDLGEAMTFAVLLPPVTYLFAWIVSGLFN